MARTLEIKVCCTGVFESEILLGSSCKVVSFVKKTPQVKLSSGEDPKCFCCKEAKLKLFTVRKKVQEGKPCPVMCNCSYCQEILELSIDEYIFDLDINEELKEQLPFRDPQTEKRPPIQVLKKLKLSLRLKKSKI